MFFLNTNRTNNTNLASAWHLLSLGQYMYAKNSMSHDNLNLSSRKRSRLQIRLESLCIERERSKKRSVVKDSVCILLIRELFF